jgi:hypothetical protein
MLTDCRTLRPCDEISLAHRTCFFEHGAGSEESLSVAGFSLDAKAKQVTER